MAFAISFILGKNFSCKGNNRESIVNGKCSSCGKFTYYGYMCSSEQFVIPIGRECRDCASRFCNQ